MTRSDSSLARPGEPASLRDIDGLPTAPEETDVARRQASRRWRRLFVALLAAFLLLGLTGALGVRTGSVSARGGGYRLDVTYARVSRPGLASPFELRVTRPGGFDGPVAVAVSQAYLNLFDENGVDPEPSRTASAGTSVLWEFEAPVGDELRVVVDARIEPGVQWGRSGRVAVLEGDRPVVAVDFTTRILP